MTRLSGRHTEAWNDREHRSNCLHWEFDAEKLERVITQLEGLNILVPDRDIDEVVSFVMKCGRWIQLDVRNKLSRKSAISVFHLFHHLGKGTCIERLFTDMYNYLYERRGDVCKRMSRQQDTSGAHLNPAIFDALRQARGGRGLNLYALKHCRLHSTPGPSMFGEGKTASVRLHFKVNDVWGEMGAMLADSMSVVS